MSFYGRRSPGFYPEVHNRSDLYRTVSPIRARSRGVNRAPSPDPPNVNIYNYYGGDDGELHDHTPRRRRSRSRSRSRSRTTREDYLIQAQRDLNLMKWQEEQEEKRLAARQKEKEDQRELQELKRERDARSIRDALERNNPVDNMLARTRADLDAVTFPRGDRDPVARARGDPALETVSLRGADRVLLVNDSVLRDLNRGRSRSVERRYPLHPRSRPESDWIGNSAMAELVSLRAKETERENQRAIQEAAELARLKKEESLREAERRKQRANQELEELKAVKELEELKAKKDLIEIERKLKIDIEIEMLRKEKEADDRKKQREKADKEAIEKYKIKKAEDEAKEKKEKEEREAEYKKRLEQDLRKNGASETQIAVILQNNSQAASPNDNSGPPTYTRMARKHLSIETLRQCNIDYTMDQVKSTHTHLHLTQGNKLMLTYRVGS